MGVQERRTRTPIQWAVALSILVASSALADDATADLQNGAAVYRQTCIACHGANGKGAIPGAPNFTKQGGVLSQPDEVLEERVEHGFHSQGSPMAMPAKGGNPSLTETDIRDVILYMRERFLGIH